MSTNPHIEYNFIVKRNHHPFVTGAYLNGYLKDIPLRSIPETDVIEVFQSLRNQLGRKPYEASGPRVYHPVKSIQGKWMPNMFNTYPRAQFEKVHHIPRATFENREKLIRDDKNLKDRDHANILLNFDNSQARDRP